MTATPAPDTTTSAGFVVPPDPFLRYLGARVSPRGQEPVVCEIDLTENLRNQGGMLNGGVTATLVDVAAGVAAARAQDSEHISTTSLSTQYLAPVRVGPARATARVVGAGRRSVVVQVEIVDAGTDADELAALATVTLARVGPRRGENGAGLPAEDQ